MRKLFFIVLMILFLSGCGVFEKLFDQANYESLSNEIGTVEMYCGGKLIYTYCDVEILYSDSDSVALWLKLNNGDIVYWQGEAHILLKKNI